MHAFSEGGSRLYVNSYLRIFSFPVDPDLLIEHACMTAGRTFKGRVAALPPRPAVQRPVRHLIPTGVSANRSLGRRQRAHMWVTPAKGGSYARGLPFSMSTLNAYLTRADRGRRRPGSRSCAR